MAQGWKRSNWSRLEKATSTTTTFYLDATPKSSI